MSLSGFIPTLSKLANDTIANIAMTNLHNSYGERETDSGTSYELVNGENYVNINHD
jgi:hypothetical protein